MTWYAIGVPGAPVRIYSRNLGQTSQQLQSGEVILAVDDLVEGGSLSADGLTIVAPTVDVEALKALRWELAKQYRDIQIASGCSTPSGRVDTDSESRQRINGAVMMASIAKSAGTEFSMDWTLSDNSVVTLDADAMIAVGVTVGQFIASCQNAGTAIRTAIDAATTVDGVASVDIEAGYPV